MKPMKELGFDKDFLERQRLLALRDAKELRERVLKMKKSASATAVRKSRKSAPLETPGAPERKPSKKQ